MDTWTDMSTDIATEFSRCDSIEFGYKFGVRHALDEDAFGQGIDRSEHFSVLALLNEVGWFLMAELGIGSKEPIMRRLWAKGRGEPFNDS